MWVFALSRQLIVETGRINKINKNVNIRTIAYRVFFVSGSESVLDLFQQSPAVELGGIQYVPFGVDIVLNRFNVKSKSQNTEHLTEYNIISIS